MQIDILTLFPDMFKGPLSESMLKIAQGKGIVRIRVHNLRDWTDDNHRTADDKPYGGGAGMVMKVEPIYRALNDISPGKSVKRKVILLSPQGKIFSQNTALRLSKLKKIVFICGHYEGVDERVRHLIDEEISIGDYILTGGELPVCVVIDSAVRLIPGVLGKKASLETESFENNLLEYPQYTRPRSFKNMDVPEVLLQGDHAKITEWRMKEALKNTAKKRPDLYKKAAMKINRKEQK